MGKLYFSRYHIDTARPIIDKIEFFMKGISNHAEFLYKGYIYKFTNTNKIKNDGKEFIIGELLKYKSTDEQDIYNIIDKVVQKQEVINKIFSSTKFIIDINSSIIMSVESANEITYGIFIKSFIDLFKNNYDNFFIEISISPIKETYSFHDAVKSLTEIKKIHIVLHPSNPNSSEIWKKTDDRLRESDITTYQEIMESNRLDGNIIIDIETSSKFAMAEDGYGKCTAQGIISDGDKITLSTAKKSKITNILIDKSITTFEDIIDYSLKKLNEIIKRTKK